MKIHVILIYLILFWTLPTFTYAREPVIFFSDLTSGPNTGGENGQGAFVTIWGKNFGRQTERASISVGDNAVASYQLWSDEKITFQLGNKAKSGDIVVSTGDRISNGIPFVIRGGAIFFVAPDGDDQRGDGSRARPWRTLLQVKHVVRPGDIVYLLDGFTHTERDDYDAYLNLDVNGKEGLPIALVAYPGAYVSIGGPDLRRCLHDWIQGAPEDNHSKHWIISQLHLTSSGRVVVLGEGYRIVGNTITAPQGNGATGVIAGRGPDAQILGNTIIDVGDKHTSKLYHNIYINNDRKDTSVFNIEIAWNTIYRTFANRGIQVYADPHKGYIQDVFIHDNLIHHTRGNAINIGKHTRGTITIFNNIVYKAGLGPDFEDGISDYSGVLIAPEPEAVVYFFHNLVYDCGYSYRPGGSGLLAYRSGTLYAINNIFAGHGNVIAPGTGIPLPGRYGNLFHGRLQPQSWDTTAVYEDPFFVDIKQFDFHLKKGSPAIDKGRALKTPVGKRDYDGNPRPQGAGFDIGPYEFTPKGSP